MPVGVGPGFFARQQCRLIRQALSYHQTLQRGQPMVIVMRTIVRLTAIRRGFQLLSQRRRPFLPGEVALC